MLGLILGLILVISVLLVLIILAQNSKGGGLSSQFGGSATSQIMGVKRTGDLLEKLTWGLAIGILVLSLSANKLIDKRQASQGAVSPNIEAAQQKSAIQNFTPDLSGETNETIEIPDSSVSE
ncbi:MAG: preprotein translocase subunit SecG [Cyclobacteriaceae bacterium]|nr:MAG: preprotein translocase subunit SecG [Cyclobacteriaceae bacterium]